MGDSTDVPPSDLTEELAKRGLDLGPVIGRGSMARVYRAFDTRHDRSLAVKVFSLEATDSNATARWNREIGAVARLRHPNILPLIDSGRTPGGTSYFLMPLAVGETLHARLTRGPLPVAEAIRYAREVAEALAYAHAEGLVHRDVKPENFLLEGGHAVLADFGLVRPMNPAAWQGIHSTQVGMVAGTPAYMSPEQLTAGSQIDGRADLFCLGVVLYEMVAGRLPFEATTMPALMTERLTGEFEAVTVLRPGVPPLLQQIIVRALAPDAKDRYDRAEAMVADLVLAEHQVSHIGPVHNHSAAGLGAGLTTAAVLLGVGIIAALVTWLPAALRLDPDRIVVADMRNETGDSTKATIGALASDLVSAGLSRIAGLTVINSDLVFGASRASDRRVAGAPGQALRSLVRATRAATVVSGSYYLDAGRLEVFAEVIDARSGRILLDLGPLSGTADHPEVVLAATRDSVTKFTQRRRAGQ